MDETQVTIIVSLVALGIGLYAVYKAYAAGNQITPQLVGEKMTQAATPAAELTEAALTGARAAEQLYRTGKIERDERLEKAFGYVRTFFPKLETETVLIAIESAVLVVNTLVDAIPDKPVEER